MLSLWHPELVETFSETYRKIPYLTLNLLTDSSGCRESYPGWILCAKNFTRGVGSVAHASSSWAPWGSSNLIEKRISHT
jgi:hypothetical protein